MNIEIPETLFDSLQIIIKYQNTLLLKEIANDKNWKLSELKKEFLKDENVESLVKKYNKKQKKKAVNKKKKEPEPVVEEPEPLVEEPEPVVEEPKSKPMKKKKIKKQLGEIEIRCHKYILEGGVFYINVDNDNAYDKNMEFVGRKLGNEINFDADELKS